MRENLSGFQGVETYYLIRRVPDLRLMLSFQQQSDNDTSSGSSDGNAARYVGEGVLVVGDTGDVQEGNGSCEDNGCL